MRAQRQQWLLGWLRTAHPSHTVAYAIPATSIIHRGAAPDSATARNRYAPAIASTALPSTGPTLVDPVHFSFSLGIAPRKGSTGAFAGNSPRLSNAATRLSNAC